MIAERVVAREERDQDAGVAVAGDQRGVGACRGPPRPRPCPPARPPRRRATHGRRSAARPAARSARRAQVAADDARARSRTWCAPSARSTTQARDHAEGEPPVHVEARQRAEHVRRRRSAASTACSGWRIAQRALDQVIEQRDRDVGEQQAADGLVDAAVGAQRARERRSRRARQRRRRRTIAERRPAGGEPPSSGTATAAAARPPSTSAPSPPITIRPSRAGSAVAQRRQHQRRRALQRVLEREPGAEGAAEHLRVDVQRVVPRPARRTRRTAAATAASAPQRDRRSASSAGAGAPREPPAGSALPTARSGASSVDAHRAGAPVRRSSRSRLRPGSSSSRARCRSASARRRPR